MGVLCTCLRFIAHAVTWIILISFGDVVDDAKCLFMYIQLIFDFHSWTKRYAQQTYIAELRDFHTYKRIVNTSLCSV